MSDQEKQAPPAPAAKLLDTSDMIILAIIGALTLLYFYTRSQGKKSVVPIAPTTNLASAQSTSGGSGR